MGDELDTLQLDGVDVTTRRAWVTALAFALLTGSLVLLLFLRQTGSAAHATLASLVAIGAVCAFFALLAAAVKWPVRQRGRLLVHAGEVYLGGRPLLRRQAVTRALSLQVEEEHLVRLFAGRWRQLTFRLPDAKAADGLLAILGQEPGQRTASFACQDGHSSRYLRLFGFLTVAGMLNGLLTWAAHRHGVHVPLMTALVFGVAGALSTSSRACTVVVGEDGFSVRKFARRPFFVPFSRVQEVRREDGAVLVAVTGDAPLRFAHAKPPRWSVDVAGASPELPLFQRLQAGCAAAVERRPHPARAFLLKGSSTREEWMRRVERLASGADEYRVASLPTEQLWSVLADPRELAEVRAGAAAAVRHHLDDARREQLRVAAGATADVPLRRIFTAVNERDERALAEAFDQLSAEEGARLRCP